MRDNLPPFDIVTQNIRDHTPMIGAIDLGTNSCRLLIASVNIVNLHRNFFKIRSAGDKFLRVVDSFARIVGLGEGVKQTGVLSRHAIERTLEALTVCQHKLLMHHTIAVRAVATEACRQAANAHVLVERAKNELDIDLEIITPQEEAQLVLHGCVGVVSEQKPYGIVLDIGGGSTEVIWLRVSKRTGQTRPIISVIDSMSLPYGVVTLRDTYIHMGRDPTIFKKAQHSISQLVRFFMTKNKITEKLKENSVQLISSSGTATTLGAAVLGLSEYARSIIDARDFHSYQLRDMGRALIKVYIESPEKIGDVIPHYERLLMRIRDTDYDESSPSHTSLVYARVGLLAAGSAILNSILEAVGPHLIRIADRGIREGLLNDLLNRMRIGQI